MSLATSLDLPSAYDRAVAAVRERQHVKAAELARDCNIAPSVAKAYLVRMEEDGVIAKANGEGRHVVLGSAADDGSDHPVVITAAAQGRLKSFIERIERLEEDKAAIAGDLKDVYGEAKGEGFDTKVMRKVVALRKKNPQKLEEEEALLDLYLSAIGGL